MKIGNREISPSHPPLVIAEIGINHGGDLEVAKNMVRLAALSGCECVKHQTHIVEDEMTDEAKQIFPPNADVSIWDVMAQCALSREDEAELKRYTEELGLIYISTPFSRAAADFWKPWTCLHIKSDRVRRTICLSFVTSRARASP